MKILVNSCIRKMDIIGKKRSRKSGAERSWEGWRHAVSKHENSGKKDIRYKDAILPR